MKLKKMFSQKNLDFFSDASRQRLLLGHKKTGKALLLIYICVQGILILRVDFLFKKLPRFI